MIVLQASFLAGRLVVWGEARPEEFHRAPRPEGASVEGGPGRCAFAVRPRPRAAPPGDRGGGRPGREAVRRGGVVRRLAADDGRWAGGVEPDSGRTALGRGLRGEAGPLAGLGAPAADRRGDRPAPGGFGAVDAGERRGGGFDLGLLVGGPAFCRGAGGPPAVLAGRGAGRRVRQAGPPLEVVAGRDRGRRAEARPAGSRPAARRQGLDPRRRALARAPFDLAHGSPRRLPRRGGRPPRPDLRCSRAARARP